MTLSVTEQKSRPFTERLWLWLREGRKFAEHGHWPSGLLRQDETKDQVEAASGYAWSRTELEAAQLIWGHGLMGPCSPNELASLTKWLEIESYMHLAITGAGLGGLGLAMARICSSTVTCFEQSETLVALSPERRTSRLRTNASVTINSENGYDRVIVDGFGHLGGDILPLLPDATRLLSPKGKMLIRTYCLAHMPVRRDPLYLKALSRGSLGAPLLTWSAISKKADHHGLRLIAHADMRDIHSAAIDMRWTKGAELVHTLARHPDSRALTNTLLRQSLIWQDRLSLMAAGKIKVFEILAERSR